MSTTPARVGCTARTFLAAAFATSMLLGCGSDGSPLGLDRPPASLDPRSPMLVAEGIAFDRTDLAVAAGETFVLILENRDAVSHNVSIYADDEARDRRFEGVLFGGPATRWYAVPALERGSYRFVCDLHPDMAGRLVAS